VDAVAQGVYMCKTEFEVGEIRCSVPIPPDHNFRTLTKDTYIYHE
jgi:hypothetical protein